jgi:hypothetical protein
MELCKGDALCFPWGKRFVVKYYVGEFQASARRAFCQTRRVEAGSNTSSVALLVGGGDEKGNLESETVKYGRESRRTRSRE